MSRSVAALVSFLVLFTLALSTGCFYDSTWGARKSAQKRNAVLATPASLAPPAPESLGAPTDDADGMRSDASTTLHVRVHAAPAYAAQTPDWKSHIRELLEQANATLKASVSAHLVIDSTDDWDRVGAGKLDVELAALRVEDAGEKADLVLGLVGGLPLATQDFEQLGLSEVGGKYLVVRAPNVAREYDTVEKAFDELSVEARAKLRRQRVRHREVAILLHEIGHSLGASHQTVEGSLMRPAYDPKMATFDDESIAKMRRRLALAAEPVVDAGAPVAATQTSAVAAPAPDDPPGELRAPDRDVWMRASEELKGGDAKEAWETARPLFASYPLLYAAQDLRCKVAMAYFRSFADVQRECAPLMKATADEAKKNKKRLQKR